MEPEMEPRATTEYKEKKKGGRPSKITALAKYLYIGKEYKPITKQFKLILKSFAKGNLHNFHGKMDYPDNPFPFLFFSNFSLPERFLAGKMKNLEKIQNGFRAFKYSDSL
ncbi:hypothetical protein [Methanosarcina sp. 1.H.A.2.2]|uniref:hypothetical protein n=1 Tax=Methanosarcina sp. 1.H.A.2.2 TaxID=1483601 RepID=UPI0012E05E04|nr:hypothetical protein [Methanosarcina sp. 1.H.A.2.2]